MQKQPKILNYKNLNREKYDYLQPHKTENGYYLSICNYRLTKNQVLPFYFETPKLKTTSGIVRIENNYYIDLELPQSGEGGHFYDFLIKNDDNNISICHENSKEWFNQVMPLNIVEQYYKTPILLRPNGNLPIIRIRIPSYKGNILTEIFNIRKEKVNDISCIQEGDLIVGILEFTGLKFLKQNFSPCYELQKIKIFKDNDFRAIPNGYIFSDANDSIDLDTHTHAINDSILEDSTEHNDNSRIINMSNEYNLATLKRPIPIKSQPLHKHNIADTPEPNIKKSPEPNINEANLTTINKEAIPSEPIESIAHIEHLESIEPTVVVNHTLTINNALEPSIDITKDVVVNKEDIKIIKSEKKNKSLYDLIKEASLNSLYLDETLFINKNASFLKNPSKIEKEVEEEEEEEAEEGEGEGDDGEGDDGECEEGEGDDGEGEEGEEGEGDGEEGEGDGEEGEGEEGEGEEGEGEEGEGEEGKEDDEEEDDEEDNDSDGDIDFETLNELEVIEFE